MKIKVDKSKIYIFIKLISFSCVIISLFAFLYIQGYRINLSDSLPYWFFKISDSSNKPISRGDYVVVDYFLIDDNPVFKMAIDRKYIGRVPILKQVGAVSGDTILLKDNILYVNGDYYCNMIINSADSKGNPLFPFPTPITLQTNQYFLVSNPDGGFDSRYFGYVPRFSITHIALPVFDSF